MDSAKLQRKLMAAARLDPVSDHVPLAFEGRLMRRLREHPPLDLVGLWAQSLWKAAAVCVGVSVLCGIWSLATLAHKDAVTLETAVFSMAEQMAEDW